jgi:hypothetical protein
MAGNQKLWRLPLQDLASPQHLVGVTVGSGDIIVALFRKQRLVVWHRLPPQICNPLLPPSELVRLVVKEISTKAERRQHGAVNPLGILGRICDITPVTEL